MTLLGAWLAASLALALLLRRRPIVLLALVLAVRLLVPAVAAPVFTGIPRGSPIGFHPATWLTLIVLLVLSLIETKALVTTVLRHPYVSIVSAAVVAGAGLTSVVGSGGGTRLLMDQLAAPIMVALMVVAFCRAPQDVRLLRDVVVGVAVVQCLLAFAQVITGSVLLFESSYLTIYWFDPDRNTRWMGTTDSPLLLSLLLSVAGSLALGYRNSLVRFALIALFMAGTLVSQSRTGAAVMIALILIAVFLTRMSLLTRIVLLAGTVLAALGAVAAGLADGLTDRIANDTGSTSARQSAISFVLEEFPRYVFSGSGLGSSFDIARAAGLHTSLENSYLMYVVDIGFVLATLYFGMQFITVLRYGLSSWSKETVLAGVVCLVSINGSSALGFGNFAGMLSWFTVALTMATSYATPARLKAGRVGGTLARMPQGA